MKKKEKEKKKSFSPSTELTGVSQFAFSLSLCFSYFSERVCTVLKFPHRESATKSSLSFWST